MLHTEASPRMEALLAITCGIGDMQAVLGLVCRSQLPAQAPAALPKDAPGPWQQTQLTPRRGADRSLRRLSWLADPLMDSGAWTNAAIYGPRLCYHETPFVYDLRCRSGEGRLTLKGAGNRSFGPTV